MNETHRLRRLNLLSGLSVRLASESAGGLLSDTLNVLLTGLGAGAGVAFDAEDTQAHFASERGFRAGDSARAVLTDIASRVLSSRRAVALHDIRSPLARLEQAGELTALGIQALIAIPVMHRRERLAVLIALFPPGNVIDEESVDFARGVGNVLSLAIARDRAAASPRGGPPDQAAERMVYAHIAHELRGPVGALSLQLEEQERLVDELGALSGSSDTALGASVSELDELTRDIRAVMQRLRQLVSELASDKDTQNQAELLDLGELVHDALAERKPHLERMGIECVTQLAEDCEVIAQRTELRRAFLALVEHAAGRCASIGRRLSVSVVQSASGVVLSVADNGPRLTTSEQRALASGQHAGANVKLQAVHHLVRELAGHIEVASDDRFPVIMRLLLPGVEGSGVFPLQDNAPVRVIKRAEVLVVDDDEVFARTMRRALKPHSVRTASSASEAEIALLDPSFNPDLVLCDVFLPGSNGDELHQRIQERRPNIAKRFVFVTGGALTAQQAVHVRTSGCATLHKPIDLDQVRSILLERCPLEAASVRTLSAPSSTRGGPASARSAADVQTAPPKRDGQR